MTYADYCVFEREAAVKHEYLRGEVFAMAGGTIEHGRLAGRIIYLLSRALEGRPCRVLPSDVRVRIEATDLDTYPDASVVCGPVQTTAADVHAIINPILLVEVLSDSTEPKLASASSSSRSASGSMSTRSTASRHSLSAQPFWRSSSSAQRSASCVASARARSSAAKHAC
jgi:hypothetical protein